MVGTGGNWRVHVLSKQVAAAHFQPVVAVQECGLVIPELLIYLIYLFINFKEKLKMFSFVLNIPILKSMLRSHSSPQAVNLQPLI